MKIFIKFLWSKIEVWFLRIPVIRFTIIFPSNLIGRVLWVWGKLRFASICTNRGDGCICHWNADLKFPERIYFGNNVIVGENVVIGAHSPVYIGNRVRISRDVMIESASLDFNGKAAPYEHISKTIYIDDDVWIGARAIVLGGVKIGKHSVVASGSIVTKDVPEYVLVAGVPARVIRKVSL